MSRPRVLVYGYGNPGRLDDGLGPACAEAIAAAAIPGVDVEANYQLGIEDSHLVADYDLVIFVDAAVCGEAPFWVQRIVPRAQLHFSSHSLDAAAVMGMAENLFKGQARGYLIGIPGSDFNEYAEGLSQTAQERLSACTAFLIDCLTRADEEALASRAEIHEAAEPRSPFSLHPQPQT